MALSVLTLQKMDAADEYGAPSFPNGTLDTRYALCNLSRYASVPICGDNGSGAEEFKPDYSHGFAMERVISIVVCYALP